MPIRGWRKVTEGGARKNVASGGIRKEDVVTFFEDTPQRMKTREVGGD